MEDGPGPAIALLMLVVVAEALGVLLWSPLRLGEAKLGSGDWRKVKSSACDPIIGRSTRPGVYGFHRESL